MGTGTSPAVNLLTSRSHQSSTAYLAKIS
jgi:hypothetical protein